MAYKDYANFYINWIDGQLKYIGGDEYNNFYFSINPHYEVTAFKQSIDVSQQCIFHNAADDQVATKRQVIEIFKSPLNYLEEYEDVLKFDLSLLQASNQVVEKAHNAQDSSNKDTLNFYSQFSPQTMSRLSQYDPTRILQ